MTLLADPPTDKDSCEALVALGRALYIASGFEEDCRILAFALKIREPQTDGQSDDEFLSSLGKVVLGKLAELNKLIARRAKLPEDYTAMLHAARDARNYIAHEAARELDDLAKKPGGISQWRETMGSKLEDLAYGKIIVAVLLGRNTAGPVPTREVINAYPRKIESWGLHA